MYWMDLRVADPVFYRELLGWEPAGAVFTQGGRVVAGRNAPGLPGWNLHVEVADVVAVCRAVRRHGGAVLAGYETSALVADPAGATLVVREPGRRAEVLHRPGAFSWAELCTPDPDAALAFYHDVFGWGAVAGAMSMPAGEVDYSVFVAGTAEVAGVLPAEAGFGAGVPPYWLAYVETEDADALAARAVELGGAVLAEPFDVPKIGRIALLAGRGGEAFAVIRMPGGRA